MLDPATFLGRARGGAVPPDWQVFVGSRRPFIAEMVTRLLGSASMVGIALVADGRGRSGEAAAVFVFFALLCALGTVGASVGLRHVDEYLLVLTLEGVVWRHFWASGKDIHRIVFADVQAMQLTRKRSPTLIVTYRDGDRERLPLGTLRLFGPPAEVGASIGDAFTRSSPPEEGTPD
jgi:hypothetical protein